MKSIFADRRRLWLLIGYMAAAAVLFCAPLYLSDFRLNLLAKFLAFAIAALGLDLLWGYTGVLSLGHGVFFGLGAYAMGMHLKLQASGARLPDFMDWSGLTKLPWFWEPFRSFLVAVLLGILIPALLALFLGFFTFRNRIKGVYFTILTQALVIIVTTLFIGQQAHTGGTNGLTSFTKLLGEPLKSDTMKIALYLSTVVALVFVFILCRYIAKSRMGKVLRAIRDGENRVRFLGYNPATYQMMTFALSGALAGIAGMLFVLHVGIISPSMMGIVPSIEMILWVAIGGRGTLIGALIGTLALNYAKSGLSEAYPDIWTIFLGVLFIVVTVFLPGGIAGLIRSGVEAVRNIRGKGNLHESGAHSVLQGNNRSV
ncbi:urea ABC transporter permease subunit UrtC [Cohnella soli]|uniref:Urea ABC transporter permease subunit UrtC n=1 Tax=Cohnella soli TaxID=425005 RepID=A0ABW0I177_9BACL